MIFCGGRIGNVLSIEGRAIRKDFQGRGFGTQALRDIVQTENVQAAASVTRNPAVPFLMHKVFRVVSPDLSAAEPLHYFDNVSEVRDLTEVYARHVAADPAELPFVRGRYGEGLYGFDDPGRDMLGLPGIAENPGDGIIMVALDRRSEV